MEDEKRASITNPEKSIKESRTSPLLPGTNVWINSVIIDTNRPINNEIKIIKEDFKRIWYTFFDLYLLSRISP